VKGSAVRPGRDQRGAALIYVAVMMLIVSLGVVYIFNAFKISNEKTRLQNTVDAAAYSVAVVEAKNLNFLAYTNRAMVANQVAAAQFISFMSWTRWLATTSDNITTVSSFFPPLYAFTGPINEAVAAYSEIVEGAMEVAITATNAIIQALSASQQIMNVATYAVALDTMRTVVNRNDADVNFLPSEMLALTSFASEHVAFSSRFSPDFVRNNGPDNDSDEYDAHKQRSDEFRDVTLNSRDRFSSGESRSYTWLSANVPFSQYRLHKAGGTELTARDDDPDHDHSLYYTWTAMDTLSFHQRDRDWDGWGSWHETPIGWGAAQTGEEVTLGRHHGTGYWNRNEEASEALEDYYPDYENDVGEFDGLRDFYDLEDRGLIDDGPGLVLMLVKANADNAVRTSENVGVNAGRVNLEEDASMANNRMSALARAGTYFARPSGLWARDTGGREYGNLYNPYWQARLEEVTTAERTAALIMAEIF